MRVAVMLDRPNYQQRDDQRAAKDDNYAGEHDCWQFELLDLASCRQKRYLIKNG
jgi:hypothetical protein